MSLTDPRAIRSRQAILEAVRWILLNEGPERVTHQRVADVANVGRATVYRHWSSADDMVFALLDEDPFHLLAMPTEASLEDQLTQWLMWMAHLIAEPRRRLVILHVFSRTEFDSRASRLRTRRLGELAAYLGQAIGDHAGWANLSPARKMDGISLLIGPIIARTLFLSDGPEEAWGREMVAVFLNWLENQV